MILGDVRGAVRYFPDDDRLLQAINIGAVRIDSIYFMKATILTPPGFENFSDDEILLQLQFAGECGKRLEQLGFTVAY